MLNSCERRCGTINNANKGNNKNATCAQTKSPNDRPTLTQHQVGKISTQNKICANEANQDYKPKSNVNSLYTKAKSRTDITSIADDETHTSEMNKYTTSREKGNATSRKHHAPPEGNTCKQVGNSRQQQEHNTSTTGEKQHANSMKKKRHQHNNK